MTIQSLKYFITLGQCLNFSEAAKVLFITQPTLSRCIASMEKHLGVTLFIRNTKFVKLTGEGKVFLAAAVEIVERYENALKNIRNLASEYAHTLNIGFLGSPFYRYFPQWIPEFRKTYPEVEISLQMYTWSQFQNAFVNDVIDICLARKIEIENYKGIHYEKLRDDYLTIAMHKDSYLAKRKSISLCELANSPFIIAEHSASPNYYSKVMQVCASRNFYPKISHLVNSTVAIYQLVSAGMGIAILPSSCTYLNYPNIRYIQINDRDYAYNIDALPSLNVEAGAIWKKKNKNPNIDLFMSIIGKTDKGP